VSAPNKFIENSAPYISIERERTCGLG